MNKQMVVLVLVAMTLLIACQKSTPTVIPTVIPTEIPTPTTTKTFKIPSGSAHEIAFDIQQGTVVEYSFEADLDFDFSVLDPVGNAITRSGRVIADEGQFRAARFGRYALKFDNGFSLFASKTVTIEYRVVPLGGR